MKKSSDTHYDAVIIGAGIGGLVCGCYLAKAGMKVLICEQHHKPGGYCTSFKRKGYTFDAAAHCFGAYRKGGIINTIVNDHKLDAILNISRADPSDIIITPDFSVSFYASIDRTIAEIQESFPDEGKNIKAFFSFLLKPPLHAFSRMRKWTFQMLLDQYLADRKLKAMLAAPLLGNGGMPPSLMSAFIGAKLFSEFMMDGGYYPEGGMQAFPDALASRFTQYGGEIRLSTRATKIRSQKTLATGISLDTGEFVPSRFIISNVDSRQTYFNLIGRKKIPAEFSARVQDMTPSLSDFVLYLGLKQNTALPYPGKSLWFFQHYDLDRAYRAAQRGDTEGIGGFFLRVSSDKSTLVAIIPAPFKTAAYWEQHKAETADLLVAIIDKTARLGLSGNIAVKEAATPQTLYRYTNNYRGASFGWAGLPTQLALPDFKKPSFMSNLYSVGHWTTEGLGISGVAYVGWDTANVLLRKNKKHSSENDHR